MSLKDTLVKSSGPVSVAVDASGVKVHNGVRVRRVLADGAYNSRENLLSKATSSL